MNLTQLVQLITNLAGLFQAIQTTPAGPAFMQFLAALESPPVAAIVTPAVANVIASALPVITGSAKK